MEVCGDDDSFHRPYICVGGFWWWCGAPSCFMLLSHILTHLQGWVCRPMLAYDTRLFHIMILIHGLIFIWLKCMGSVGYVEGIRVMICNWLQVSISWSLFYFSDLLLTVGSESLSALSGWNTIETQILGYWNDCSTLFRGCPPHAPKGPWKTNWKLSLLFTPYLVPFPRDPVDSWQIPSHWRIFVPLFSFRGHFLGKF